MAYVDQELSKEGTKLTVTQRGKKHKIGVVKMSFVQSGYFKGWKDFWLWWWCDFSESMYFIVSSYFFKPINLWIYLFDFTDLNSV